MAGAASHIDLFDYKPELDQAARPAGPISASTSRRFRTAWARGSSRCWPFKAYGECGKMLSESVAPLGDVVDDIAFVHNVVGKTGVHSQGTLLQTTGLQPARLPGHGLLGQLRAGQHERQPADVRRAARPSRPGVQRHEELGQRRSCRPRHQGTVIYPGSEDADRRPVPGRAAAFHHARTATRPAVDLLGTAEPRARRQRARATTGSRRASAATSWPRRCSSPRPEALDLSKEPEHILKLYGLDHGKIVVRQGDQRRSRRPTTSAASAWSRAGCSSAACASCRSGAATTTAFRAATGTSTKTSQRDHGPLAARHGPRRGGADPGPQAARPARRHDHPLDHRVRPHAVERRAARGATTIRTASPTGSAAAASRAASARPERRVGLQAADRKHPTEVYDIHATILHLLGIDHTKLTVRHNGIDRRLTDVHGHVIRGTSRITELL